MGPSTVPAVSKGKAGPGDTYTHSQAHTDMHTHPQSMGWAKQVFFHGAPFWRLPGGGELEYRREGRIPALALRGEQAGTTLRLLPPQVTGGVAVPAQLAQHIL